MASERRKQAPSSFRLTNGEPSDTGQGYASFWRGLSISVPGLSALDPSPSPPSAESDNAVCAQIPASAARYSRKQAHTGCIYKPKYSYSLERRSTYIQVGNKVSSEETSDQGGQKHLREALARLPYSFLPLLATLLTPGRPSRPTRTRRPCPASRKCRVIQPLSIVTSSSSNSLSNPRV